MRLLNEHADVVADDLAQHLVDHRHGRLAAHVVAELARTDTFREGFGVITALASWRAKHTIRSPAPTRTISGVAREHPSRPSPRTWPRASRRRRQGALST